MPEVSPRIDRQSWLAGFVAGEARQPASLGWKAQDIYSWHSGWVEGDAKRQGREYSLGAITPADVAEYKAGKRNPTPIRPPLLPKE